MTIEKALQQRSNNQCELCASSIDLFVYEMPPAVSPSAGSCILMCKTCDTQLSSPKTMDSNHWRGLNDSMWSPELPVQVMSWRALTLMSQQESWASDLLDMMYLEHDHLEWAKSGLPEPERPPCLDSNGTELQAGDNVSIIKDLPVKGSSMIIKRGTAVRNIGLTDDPLNIQGKADGVGMVIIAAYCKKNK
jgi:protein PhnA